MDNIKTNKIIKDSESRKVLLMGYNGANNTGSETRLISIIEDLRNILGPEVKLTIPTLNEKNLRRYIKEDQNLKIVPIPSIYFIALKNLVKEHDLVLLVEGSCYMDTWTSALLWAFLWTTRCADSYGVPCVAYAVDAGNLSRLNRFLVKREASKTDLIITRTKYAGVKLKKMGVKAPIEHTADCAFTYKTDPCDKGFLDKIIQQGNIPNPERGFVGLAVIDFYLWPVVIRPWGRTKNLYKWPYYFSRSKKRMDGSEKLSSSWAKEADRIVETHKKNIAIICMEELDEDLAITIKAKMKNSENAIITSARDYNASQMTEILRGLELLVTSRYHAGVLSLENFIPQIGIGHDPRLKGLYKDLKIDEEYLIDYIYNNEDDQLIWKHLTHLVNQLIEDPQKIQQRIHKGYSEQLALSKMNKKFLRNFLKIRGWKVIF
jgi:polysaccharide pyruvyl transferase WcaK-like protein